MTPEDRLSLVQLREAAERGRKRWKELRLFVLKRRRQRQQLATAPKAFNPKWDAGAYYALDEVVKTMSRLARARRKGR